MYNPQPSLRPRPWPQPSPIFPDELAAAVLFPALADLADFDAHVGQRYRKTVAFKWPEALAFGVHTRKAHLTDDEEFASLFWNTSMSRMLCPTLDPVDRERFAEVLAELPQSSQVFKIDLSGMDRLVSLPRIYATGTVTLVERNAEGDYLPRAIWINGLLLRPTDTHAWALAKLFVLQGAAFHMITVTHYSQHFPMDSIIAVTQASLPAQHPLRLLLDPHFRFTLGINNAALHTEYSVLSNKQAYPYTPFASTGLSIYQCTALGYAGIPGNSGYPSYRFVPGPNGGELPYDRFLRGYYDRFLPLVEAVAGSLEEAHRELLSPWADEIARWVPGFPDATAIRSEEVLVHALTRVMWNVTVSHSADHSSFGRIPLDRIPLRIRIPPPKSPTIPRWDPARVCTLKDWARYWLAVDMFIKEQLVLPLTSVRYGFTGHLNDEVEAFRRRLREYDRDLDGTHYIPLVRISSSIQY